MGNSRETVGEKISKNTIIAILSVVGLIIGFVVFFTGKNLPDFFKTTTAEPITEIESNTESPISSIDELDGEWEVVKYRKGAENLITFPYTMTVKNGSCTMYYEGDWDYSFSCFINRNGIIETSPEAGIVFEFISSEITEDYYWYLNFLYQFPGNEDIGWNAYEEEYTLVFKKK